MINESLALTSKLADQGAVGLTFVCMFLCVTPMVWIIWKIVTFFITSMIDQRNQMQQMHAENIVAQKLRDEEARKNMEAVLNGNNQMVKALENNSTILSELMSLMDGISKRLDHVEMTVTKMPIHIAIPGKDTP